jgi:hypothetical protein
MQACDKDCVLSDWNEWTMCSKNCEGGTTFRTRSIAEAVVGQGNCADEMDETRMNTVPCNTNGCLKEKMDEPLPCHATVDVILILDGSTSIGEDGWEATKKFAKTFVKAFTEEGSNAEMSVILFSGPTTWNDYYTCIGGTQQTAEFMEATCGVKTVQHFSADLTATDAAIEALTWPKGSTLTQGALGQAAAELTLGRPDVSSVVILVTDGQPISAYRTGLAATELKKGARLLAVPVGGKGLSDEGKATIQGLVSYPPTDNIVDIDSFATLTEISSVDKIIADMCPEDPCGKWCGLSNIRENDDPEIAKGYCNIMTTEETCNLSYLWMSGDGVVKPCHWSGTMCATYGDGMDWVHCAANPKEKCDSATTTTAAAR